MARIRIGDTPDPMESMYTSSHSVDLTRNNKKQPKTEDNSVPLYQIAEDKEKLVVDTDIGIGTIKEAPELKVDTSYTAHMDTENVKAFDPTTIIPKKEKRDEGVDELFSELDMAIAREKESITERHNQLYEAMYEESQDLKNGIISRDVDTTTSGSTTSEYEDAYDMDSDDDMVHEEVAEPKKNINIYHDDDMEEESEPEKERVEVREEEEEPKKVTISKKASETFDYDDDEVDSDLSVENTQPRKTEEEIAAEEKKFIEDLKSAVKTVVRGSESKSIDLSKFKIADKGIKASKVILANEKDENIGDWVLYDSGHPIAMSALSGPELIKLDPENSTRNRYNTIKDIYKIIYNHVVDSKKPNFENWLKQTKYTDLDHIYFALYMATFGGSNFISYQCPDCKHVFIKDQVKFDDMINYKDDAVKAKVKEILSQNTDVGEVEYNVELIQVSDEYVFGMKAPSLYNVVMETAGLPENILEKYADLIDTITYIDTIYTVDYTNMNLIPVIIPTVEGDPVKTTIKRVQNMYDILKKLSSDEYYKLRGYITKLNESSADITYMIPEAVCPECETKIEANKDVDASTLLFTRHHLGAFANM